MEILACSLWPMRIVMVGLHLGIPVILAYRLAAIPFNSFIELVFSASALLTISCFLVLVGRWDWFGVWLRQSLLCTASLLVAYRFSTERQLTWQLAGNWPVGLLVDGALSLLGISLTLAALAGRQSRKEPRLDLPAFPLPSGVYYVAQGGSSRLINRYWPTSGYAVDIVKLGPMGTRARGLMPTKLPRYTVWKEAVISPVQGIVLYAVDKYPDEINTSKNAYKASPLGNHIMVRTESDPPLYMLLGRLRRSSITVHPGELIRPGRKLAEVGCSGPSLEPRLHIQCWSKLPRAAELDRPPDRDASVSLSLHFNNQPLVRNRIIVNQHPETIAVEQLAPSAV